MHVKACIIRFTTFTVVSHLQCRNVSSMRCVSAGTVLFSFKSTVHCCLLLVSAVQSLQPKSHHVLHSKKARVLCLLQIVQTTIMAAKAACWQLCGDSTHVLRAEHRQPHTVECQLMHLLSAHHRHFKTCAACFITTAGHCWLFRNNITMIVHEATW